MGKAKTHEKYVEELTVINPNIEIIDNYVNTATAVLHRCKIDGYIWSVKPHRILRGQQCPICKNQKLHKERAKTHKEYVQELYENNINIDVVERYVNCRTKIYHQCRECGHKWIVLPGAILNGQGCPVCTHKIIGDAPQFLNSIWASDYKDFYSKYMSEDDMKSIMPNSGQKIIIHCPHCNYEKTATVNSITKSGFKCLCDDGLSFPNKFVYSVLKQLDIRIKTEYSPEWANRKRYDNYLLDYNIIIENHGIQHYKEMGTSKFRSLQEEQANDVYKKEMAIKNGITKYIVLDCRCSTLAWIKKSIMNSELPILLNFTENDIDWNKALSYAANSLVYKVAEIYQTEESLPKISNLLDISVHAVRKYLKIATQLELCNYDAQACKEKVYERTRHNSIRLQG